MLHRVSKHIVQQAKENKEAIVFENISYIRRLYQKGNGQGNTYRGMMNSWSFSKIKHQVEYKARWLGIPSSYLLKRLGVQALCVLNAGRDSKRTNVCVGSFGVKSVSVGLTAT